MTSTLPRSLALLTVGVVAQFFGGCGSVVADPGTGGGSATSTGTGTDSCLLEGPGKAFTFHVLNTSKQKLFLTFGCGATLPLALESAGGTLRAGPGVGNGSQCEYTCEQVYKGGGMSPCTDCGAGVGVDLPPGGAANIPWDRRVYVDFSPEPKCVAGEVGACAKGSLVPPSSTQKGVLTVCSDVQGTPIGSDCSEAGKLLVNFVADTMGDEATITYP